jgi:hypothetical protein
MFNRRHANREDSNRQTSYHGNIRNLRYENVNDGSGNFQYYFVNDDGTSVFQRGFLKAPEVSGEEPSQAQMGYYEYISSEGKKIRVRIENTFRCKQYFAPSNEFEVLALSPIPIPMLSSPNPMPSPNAIECMLT